MPEDIYAEVGRRIRETRQELGLTLEQLSELSGLTPGYLGQIERDVKKASLMTLVAVSHAMGVPVASFLGESGPLATLPCARKLDALLRTLTPYETEVLLATMRCLAAELKKLRKKIP